MKKRLFTLFFLILIVFSLIFPAQIIEASTSGLLVWFEQILPALLPFTIVSTILMKSNYLNSLSTGGNLLAIAITMCSGFVFGFPIGAKLASDFYKNKLLSERQATLLSIAANNFSPMYVCGFVLPTLFSENTFVFSTYILIYIIPLFFAACLLAITFEKEQRYIRNTTRKNFKLSMSDFDDSIINGFQILIKLCGYIVLFSIFAKITTIVFQKPIFPLMIILENLEITNGIRLLSNSSFSESTTYILAIQLLSFGGLSGIAQTNSVFADSKLSIYKYIIGKVTLSLLLTLLTEIYVSCFIRLP